MRDAKEVRERAAAMRCARREKEAGEAVVKVRGQEQERASMMAFIRQSGGAARCVRER